MQAPEDPHYNRRARGTRVYALRNRIVLSIMAASGLFGIMFHFLPPNQAFLRQFNEWSQKENEFVQERRVRLANSLMSKSSQKIKEEQEEFDEKCM